ncbi:hypothetical protein AGR13a_Lc90176 [Agrobacterium genomosp. 13 str. CFBP 6927]|uniref:Uncharacterized protein n=1 Tax=Agrobacterium genomosp. 13 str. CFBP 6927 TaxID=1183428 RepID=A0ABM9VNA1_9HYPH|nr:hypothetical protein AGR13a_Lc90176 [Agrobacterium genomosp. 13 str. CFBP 6927]
MPRLTSRTPTLPNLMPGWSTGSADSSIAMNDTLKFGLFAQELSVWERAEGSIFCFMHTDENPDGSCRKCLSYTPLSSICSRVLDEISQD